MEEGTEDIMLLQAQLAALEEQCLALKRRIKQLDHSPISARPKARHFMVSCDPRDVLIHFVPEPLAHTT
jgi:hypothetical protein